uniref:Uncharacterized protein n=1 Tax=Eucampia antarctica TaxID=49252 RepID=A0A7S2S5A2_9STRA|mmetsp:Transcript_3134/g.3018  ORF Transcript_3134/g.3018 Transcript_3134/m.3018 type:complete len:221 (+) Transcript_3134:55-717(+)|eukprot:CAMPEP_0197826060 /NCGR_PEP_ID=MMETSP1437-20131217/3065_1 /TAXON_ID=49252 ORGANISM="Eucampia antarctica, Strain CCMP1452" /NCGR_SAMPLE_ID=MMETSP1437 /ASSEMBLY_ACC=CAM_ASM_001096 /LENGTH=220 /DNA_ID=CAMNT_0043426323 /DNA_START=82 /DNA_END=744 /DNA_ORIENTATION=-
MKISISSLVVGLLCAAGGANAYTTSTGGSMTSSFGGAVVYHRENNAISSGNNNQKCVLEMKKGKANVPPQMRSQYKRQQEISSMQKSMMDAQKPGADGFPVFNLFVRTKRANMWYPCGSFKGDDKSGALAASYVDDGMMAGVSKNQLDAGVAGSLFRDFERLKGTVTRAYPQLRKSQDELEFGYKLGYAGLTEEQSKINKVEPKEQKGLFSGLKSMFGSD